MLNHYFVSAQAESTGHTSEGNSNDAQTGSWERILAAGFLSTPPNRMQSSSLLSACFPGHLSKWQFAKLKAALDLGSSKPIFPWVLASVVQASHFLQEFFFFGGGQSSKTSLVLSIYLLKEQNKMILSIRWTWDFIYLGTHLSHSKDVQSYSCQNFFLSPF